MKPAILLFTLFLLMLHELLAADLTLNGAILREQCRWVGLDPAEMTGTQGLKAMSCIGFVHGFP